MMHNSLPKQKVGEHLITTYLASIAAAGIGTEERVAPLARPPIATAGLAAWIAEIQDDSELLQHLAQDSYRHENGFAKLLIAWSSDDCYRLRFHLWPPRYNNANVHDHRFSFWSHVVEGTLTNRTWTVAKNSGSLEQFSYKTQPGAGHTLTFMGTAELSMTSEDTIQAGSLYRINQDTLHTSDVEGISPLTIVLEDRRNLKSDVTVLSTRYGHESQAISDKRFSPNEYLLLAKKAEHIISARSG